MFSLAAAHPAKIESHYRQAGLPQAPRQAVDHLIMHGAAIQRMRMADHRGHARRGMLRLFQQSFERPGGTGNDVRFDATRHRGCELTAEKGGCGEERGGSSHVALAGHRSLTVAAPIQARTSAVSP